MTGFGGEGTSHSLLCVGVGQYLMAVVQGFLSLLQWSAVTLILILFSLAAVFSIYFREALSTVHYVFFFLGETGRLTGGELKRNSSNLGEVL